MSNHKAIYAKLKGWDGPIFLRWGDELHKIWAKALRLTPTSIKDLGRFIFGREESDITMQPMTSEGYAWLYGLEIKQENYSIIILFPKKQDEEKKDGTTSDRHIAVYTRGEPRTDQVNEILRLLTESMKSMTLKAQAE